MFLDATVLNDLQLSGAENEKRFSELGLIDAFKSSTQFVDFLPPSAIEAFKSMSSLRNSQIPYIKDQEVTVNLTPGFDFIPTNLEESAVYNFTAIDVQSGLRHFPSSYENNQIDEKAALDAKLKNILYAMANVVEGQLESTLETIKTQVLDGTVQVNQGSLGGTFTFAADTLSLNKAAQQQTMFSSIDELFTINEVPGSIRYVVNRGGLAVQKTEALQFGAGNERNLQALGMVGVDRMHQTGNLAAGSDVFNGYAIRDGAVGMYENYPYDFRHGTEVHGKKWKVSDIELPFLKMKSNIYTNNEATDSTALVNGDSNGIMSNFSEMAIWTRYYRVFRVNSDRTTRASDVFKIKGLTT